MTHTTEQDRAHALAEKHGATSYRNRADTSNPAFGFTLGQLEALISEVEQAARHAPVVPQDEVVRGVMHLIDDWSEKDFVAASARLDPWSEHDPSAPVQMLEKLDREACAARLAIEQKLRDLIAAAPQPPEVAPVQLPEPVAKVEDGGLKWHIPDSGYSLPVRYLQGTHKLYTEQQVRQLLADHGIKVNP